ncbi:ATP-binding protein [Streptomyces sp. NPDC087263]|uniref:ATP-binding protein n=1 Tax=Streptomyces sp. NPDC087263 TaxID=3365773 RepID=UPI00382FDEC3
MTAGGYRDASADRHEHEYGVAMASDDGDDNGRTENRADVGGDANAPVVVGSNNLVIGVDHGSTLTLLMEGERPQPTPRERVELFPRRQDTPLGREADLQALKDAVRTGNAVQLWGPPGIGKSALLRYAAHELPPGRHGVLFLDAARREPEDLAQDMFEACYESRGYAPSRTELCRLMADFKITVYVDNATFTREQLSTLMDTAPKATFVFAARDRALLGDGTALRLHGIDRAAAMLLLARELGRPVTAPDEQDTASTLWETAHGRPLLLLRAAALTRLDPSGESVLPRPGAVAELLPLLFDSLDGASIRALHLLATLGDAELAPEHIGALSDASDASELCANLTELGLAEETELGYRVVSDVVPELRRRGGSEPVPVDRLCHHFTTWITRPTTTPAEIAGHARALEVVAELAERAGRADLAVQVVRAASPALARSLRFGIWGRLLDQGLPAAQHAGDRQAVAYFTHERGIRNFLVGNRVLAGVLLAEAAILWRQLGDMHGVDAASTAQQYVPQPSPADPASAATPHTDGGGNALTSSGPDPSSVQGAGSPSVDPSSLQSGSSPPDLSSAQSAATQGTSVPADPVTAAHHVVATPPPGVGEVGSATAHSAAGGTHAASTGVGAAGAAPASTGVAAALKVAAVIIAVAIGGVAVNQYQDEQNRAESSALDISTADTADTGLYDTDPVDPYPPDTGLYEEEPTPTPTPTPTGLAGVWWSSEGGTYEFVEAGYETYTVEWEDNCGGSYTSEYTGSGGTYSATEPLYDADDNSCGAAPLGDVLVSVTLNPDGDTADLTIELTSDTGQVAECYSCGSFTLTREL